MDVSVLAAAGIVATGGLVVLAYWQLVVAEGAYLGRRAVVLLYDAFARRYDRTKDFDPALDAEHLAAPILRHWANVKRGATRPLVLDIATGTGRLPLALLREPAFCGRMIALDASAKMLDVARAKLSAHSARVTFIHHVAEQLPFDDASVDVVACLEALEFFADREAALGEMRRVLRPGGLLLVSNRVGPEARWLPGRVVTTESFCRRLAALGFERVEARAWLVDYDLVFARASAIESGETICPTTPSPTPSRSPKQTPTDT